MCIRDRVTALVGPSGAGKSTVFHLLTRLADPQAGRLTLNGSDLRAFDPAALRAAFAVVAQDTALFDETIAANVRLGATDRSCLLYTSILDHLLRYYAREEARSGIGFLDWVATAYDPAEVTASYARWQARGKEGAW